MTDVVGTLKSQFLVGVIDTGFSVNALDINYSQVLFGTDLVGGNDNPLLAEGVGDHHGSYVLQMIDVPSARFLWLGRAAGSGRWAESLVEFVDTVKVSGHHNAVVNLSFDLTQLNSDGSITTRYQLTSQERVAIEYARQIGVLIVAASGNENGAISALGRASQEYDNIITVGAAEGLSRASYSNYGNGLTILADGSSHGGRPLGTSAATARVTSAISRMWIANPQLNYQQVREVLQTTATDLTIVGWDVETGFGLLNLEDAVNLAIATPPTLKPTCSEAALPIQNSLVELDNVIALLERPAGFFDDIGDFFEDVANGLVDGIVTIGGVLIDVAAFPFKTLGDAIQFITDKAGDGLKAGFSAVGLDFVGDTLNFITDRVGEKAQGILERGAQYIENLPSRIERTANDLFSDNLWNNFGRWASENLTNSLELLGASEIAETIADLLKINTRALTDREKEVARSVFGDSINLDLVRIDEYSLGNLVNGERPFTTLNTINTWKSLDDATLIHELTHVWQYGQVGAIYIPDALDSQGDPGVPGTLADYPPNIEIAGSTGYRYGGFTELEKRINDGQKLSSFSYEQQAKIVEDYYSIREDGNAANDRYLPLYAYFVQEVSTLPLANLTPASVGSPLVVGATSDDQIKGDDRNDILFGLAGDDTIDGGLGDDRMYGGLGNDTLVVNSSNDVVIEFLDQGIDTVKSFTSYSLGDAVENLVLLGNTAINGTGNLFNNTITGNTADNTLNGLVGNDTLNGLAGNDTLFGDAGNDSLAGGDGDDLLIGSEGIDQLQGGDGNDLLFGGSESDILVGDDGDDQLFGETGDDIVSGGAGDDLLFGFEGDDHLFGDAGDDVLYGEAGNNAIDGGTGIDTVSYRRSFNSFNIGVSVDLANNIAFNGIDGLNTLANIENIVGSQFADRLIGNNQGNTILGGDGDDTLTGGAGADTLIGEDGTDTASYTNSAVSVSVDLTTGKGSSGDAEKDKLQSIENLEGSQQDDTLIGNAIDNHLLGQDGQDVLSGYAGQDSLHGGKGDDKLFGNVGDDILYGENGNDTLDSGAGNDSMIGGTGNDVYIVESSIDTITEDINQGRDTVKSSITYTLGANLENLILTGKESINGMGNNLENIILGNDAGNFLFGDGGKDILSGGDGDDTLDGGVKNDMMAGGLGNDTYIVDRSADQIIEDENEGIDTANASVSYALSSNLENLNLIGSNVINGTGNSLNNIINGNDAGNYIYAREGVDLVNGAAGNDYIYGEAGDDSISGNEGSDNLNGGLGNDVIAGNNGRDWLVGDLGNDRLSGGADKDHIVGGTGNDVVIGGSGNDWLTGGAGADKFIFHSWKQGIDFITDFRITDGDRIVVSAKGFDKKLEVGTLSADQFSLGSGAKDESDRFIYDSSTGKLFFDADGIGSVKQVQLATLSKGLSLTQSDISVIA